jgi:hypothetical protein
VTWETADSDEGMARIEQTMMLSLLDIKKPVLFIVDITESTLFTSAHTSHNSSNNNEK